MEFDNQPPLNDKARRLAESKKLTLQPIHADVSPEEAEGEAVARHLAGPAIANVSNDIDQVAPLVEPSKQLLKEPVKNTRRSARLLFSIVVTIGVLVVGVGFFIFVS